MTRQAFLDQLLAEHRELERLLDVFLETIRAPELDRVRFTGAFHELWSRAAPHLTLEEELFYPRFGRFDAGFAHKMLEQHQTAREAAHRIEELLNQQHDGDTRADRELLQAARLLHAMLQHHLIEEERNAFPRFP